VRELYKHSGRAATAAAAALASNPK